MQKPQNKVDIYIAKLHWPHFQDAVDRSSLTYITNDVDFTFQKDSFFFFLDYCYLIMTSSHVH